MAETPDEIVSAKPVRCAHCQAALGDADHVLHGRYDKIDLPQVAPVVTRVERYAAHCRCCGGTTLAPVPEGLEPGTPFSVGIVALAMYLRFVHAISYQRLSRLLLELFGLAISEGALDAAFRRGNPAFDADVASILARLRRARVVCSDETSVRVAGRTCWNWAEPAKVPPMRSVGGRQVGEHAKLWGGRVRPPTASSAHSRSTGAEPTRSRQHPTTLHAPLPNPGIPSHRVVAARIAQPTQCLKHPDQRQPLAAGFRLIGRQQLIQVVPPRADPWKRLLLALIAELRRVRPEDLAHDLSRHPQLAADQLDRLALDEMGSPYPRNRLHNKHPKPALDHYESHREPQSSGGFRLHADHPTNGVPIPRREHAKLWGAGVIEWVPRPWNGSELMTQLAA